MVVGARCEVIVDNTDPVGNGKRGTIQYVGPTKFVATGGDWIGVEYDEPVGKNDGSSVGKLHLVLMHADENLVLQRSGRTLFHM